MRQSRRPRLADELVPLTTLDLGCIITKGPHPKRDKKHTQTWDTAPGTTTTSQAYMCNQAARAEHQVRCQLPPPAQTNLRVWAMLGRSQLAQYLGSGGQDPKTRSWPEPKTLRPARPRLKTLRPTS